MKWNANIKLYTNKSNKKVTPIFFLPLKGKFYNMNIQTYISVEYYAI